MGRHDGAFFDGTAVDNRIYSSKGYFIDHIANHGHKDIGVNEYADLQKVFSYPDEVIKDTRKKPNGKNRDSLLSSNGSFVKMNLKNYDVPFVRTVPVRKKRSLHGNGKAIRQVPRHGFE